jgi:2,4-dienoyl-CoA reductase-like NADH-dependent reductase (Old Yellow Enzyme family)/thioredoxin reductase
MTAGAAKPFPHLFSPLPLGKRQARNRVFRAATATNLAEKFDVSDRLLAHYATLARGGAGIIVTESMRIHPSAVVRGSNLPGFDPKIIPGLTRWADAVHDAGALLIGQINHSGREHNSTTVPPRLIGPSAIACPRSGGVPHVMSDNDIADFIKHAIAAGRNMAEAGLDGIEVHCAQGHLLQQFVSPFSNRRTDRWGGSWENRTRFLREILNGVRASTSSDFIVGLRLGVDEFTDGGWTLEMSQRLVDELVDQRLIDYVSLSQGNFNTIDTHLPDRHYKPAPFQELHAKLKAAVPAATVIAATRIVTPAQAETIVAEGADGVALGRALTVDPEWPRKAERGEADSIRLCIGCNHCWDGLHEGGATLTCVYNPTVGREAELLVLTPATQPASIVVLGGGPAGMEAARIAAARGHRVVLFEREQTLGGKAATGAALGGHIEYGNVAIFLEREVRSSNNIVLRLGEAASASTVAGLAPKTVLVATGATPVPLEVPGDRSIPVATGFETFPPSLAGKHVLLSDEDGYWWGAQAAEEVVNRGGRLTFVTRFFEPFREMPTVSRIAALRHLDRHGATVLALHEIKSMTSRAVVLQHYASRREMRIENVDVIVGIGPQAPNDGCVEELRRAGISDVRVIGDAYTPRRLRHAINEAHTVARNL